MCDVKRIKSKMTEQHPKPKQPKHISKQSQAELKDLLMSPSRGFADPMFCQSLVITLGDRGVAIAKDCHIMKCLTAIQGTYWLVSSHCGSPSFKQAPGESAADPEHLIWFLPFLGVEGWYVLADYPLSRREFEDLADSGKIVAYFPGVSSTICCCHDTPQQVHCPYWAKEPVPDLLVTAKKNKNK